MVSWRNNLNSMQEKAVTTYEGPVMVVAGAGSGKTSVLTKRIAHLILNLGVPKDAVLAITFTNKAALEMKTRLYELLEFNTHTMWISTFHSMCVRILREHIEHLDYHKHFQIVDDDDTLQIIKSLMKRHGVDAKIMAPHSIKNYVLKIKTDEARMQNLEQPMREIIEIIYPAYQKQLKDNNLVDFDDLILLTIRLLEDFPEIQKRYHRQFEYILVDEFQDTNTVQYRLIRALVNEKKNVFIVGDEDQSIYAFRGANIENIQRFKRDYHPVNTIVLEQNYRSTNTILKAANAVIKENKNRIKKNLFSTKGDGDKIVFFKAYSERDEVEYVAETIRLLVRSGIDYQSIAVLYRTNNTSRLFEEVFMQKQLPYLIYGNTSFFKRKEIKDLVAYLRLIINPHDDYSFMRVVNEPRRGIGAKTIETLSRNAEHAGLSIYETLVQDKSSLSKGVLNKINHFITLMQSLQKHFDTVHFNQFIDDLLERIGYLKMLQNDDKGDVRLENMLEIKTMFKEAENSYDVDDKTTVLLYMLEDIALKSQEEKEKDPNSVSLMTLHAAKGLEFDVVFMVALEKGIFPQHRHYDSLESIEEERRLMYVGVTRCKQQLYLTNASQRYLYGSLTQNLDTPFIQDISPTLLQLEGLNKERMKTTLRYTQDYQQTQVYKERLKAITKTNENHLDKGNKVNHKVFGIGVVVSVNNDQCVIAFSHPHGIKTLMKDHPSISKV